LLLGRLALRLLVFLHGFTLFPGSLLLRFLVLLGRSPGLDSIFSDTSVFTLGIGRYRPCNAQGGKQYESGESFHNVSEGKILGRFYTEALPSLEEELGLGILW
jgi:hypothetical protein